MTSDIYTLYPIKNNKIFELYKRATASYWVPEEIDISEDKKDWNGQLTQKEKEFIKYILGFFAGSDGVVMENLVTDFYTKTKNSEGRNFYAFQIAMEAVHSELYSLLIDTYIQNDDEKNALFAATENMPVIKAKFDWALKWISPDHPWEQRLIAFAIVEGIFFSGAFCSIYWLKDRGLMPGLSLSNVLISRDEGLHTVHACEQYALVPQSKKIPTNVIYEMIKEAVAIELDFVDDALKFNLPGMNAKLMKQYVRYVTDWLLTMLNCDKLYNDENPFEFMEKITMSTRENFFEGRNGEYQKSNVMEVYHRRMKERKERGETHGQTNTSMDTLEILNKFASDYHIPINTVSDWYKEYTNKADNDNEKCNELELSDDF